MRKSIKKKILVAKTILTFLSVIELGTACPSVISTQNEAPNTYIKTEVQKDGNVKYTVSGTDKDGSIENIFVSVNGNYYGTFPNNYSFTVPIIEGDNIITATAYDNKGEKDSTPATNTFNSPTEYEATEIILNALNPIICDYVLTNYVYGDKERNVIIGLEDEDIVIDYMGEDKEIMDYWGIRNCCPKITSRKGLEKEVTDFKKNGYH